MTVRIRRSVRSCPSDTVPLVGAGPREEQVSREPGLRHSLHLAFHVQARGLPQRLSQALGHTAHYISYQELPGPVQARQPGRQCMLLAANGEAHDTQHVFSRAEGPAPPRTPGSGLWSTSSTRPSARTSCLLNTSQKMAPSCSSPTCPTCTRSLSGVKGVASGLRVCRSPFCPDVLGLQVEDSHLPSS